MGTALFSSPALTVWRPCQHVTSNTSVFRWYIVVHLFHLVIQLYICTRWYNTTYSINYYHQHFKSRHFVDVYIPNFQFYRFHFAAWPPNILNLNPGGPVAYASNLSTAMVLMLFLLSVAVMCFMLLTVAQIRRVFEDSLGIIFDISP